MNGLHIMDAREFAAQLPPQSVQTIVTSPPYWGLRSYLPADDPAKALEMGSEPTPDAYVANLVALFAALRPALRDDGTLWLNLGDSYAGGGGYWPDAPSNQPDAAKARKAPGAQISGARIAGHRTPVGTKPKDLVGIPWLVAFALRADGWYLRSDIIWSKPNPMPESVQDRPTRAHEYLFLLTKSPRYFYDADAIREEAKHGRADWRGNAYGRLREADPLDKRPNLRGSFSGPNDDPSAGRNKRSVWTLPTFAYPEAHYATFPPELVRPCILAGTSAYGACAACGAPWRRVVERTAMVLARSGRGEALGEHGRTATSGTMLEPPTSVTLGWEPSCQCGTSEVVPCLVLDPFVGSGTVAAVAIEEGRRWVGCDLDARNAALVTGRTDGRQVRMGVTA